MYSRCLFQCQPQPVEVPILALNSALAFRAVALRRLLQDPELRGTSSDSNEDHLGGQEWDSTAIAL